MTGQQVGYIRVSSVDQNPDRQLKGIALDKVFTEQRSAVSDRPVWESCLQYLREGDTLHVHSIDRLARSLTDLKDIIDTLVSSKVTVHFHSENLIFTHDKHDPLSMLLLHVIGAVAEFEHALIRERQREGIAAAKKKGKTWGRPAAVTQEQKQEIIKRIKQGERIKNLALEFDISRVSIYRYAGEDEGCKKLFEKRRWR